MTEQIPDRTTPLIGWRVWQVTSDEKAPLTSVTQQAVLWEPFKQHEAKCLCGGRPMILPQTVPHTCGIHAAKTVETVIGYYQGCGMGIWQPAYVLGRVRLWGRVIVHDNGIYRAQYAYPDAFVWDVRLNLSGKALAQYLATVYGVTAEAVQLPLPATMQPTIPNNPWQPQVYPQVWPQQPQVVPNQPMYPPPQGTWIWPNTGGGSITISTMTTNPFPIMAGNSPFQFVGGGF